MTPASDDALWEAHQEFLDADGMLMHSIGAFLIETGDRKIVGRQGKAVLKEAAASVLPREIVYRPKGLFSAPLRAWMSRDLAPLVREVVNDGVLVGSGVGTAPTVGIAVGSIGAGMAGAFILGSPCPNENANLHLH